MPWIVGIDEAGYGPNLGPLVMTSVACRAPAESLHSNWWKLLKGAVRRAGNDNANRLPIDDSKLVYSTSRGLADLESGLHGTLFSTTFPCSAADLLGLLCPDCVQAIRSETWFRGERQLPVEPASSRLARMADRFTRHCEASGLRWGAVRVAVVCPTAFNQRLDYWGSKGAVLGQALADLLAANRDLEHDGEAVVFIVDKHGGRNTYAALLQSSQVERLVVAHEEGRERSVYSLAGAEPSVRFVFQPRADSEHLCAALASMVSKYVREILMLDFNEFWGSHVPGLKATAGYPGDAQRFFEDILPAVQRLNLPRASLWRER